MPEDWGPGAWLIAFVAAQRFVELAFAARNTARLRAAGAVEFGASHYPLMVALHGVWLLTLWLAGRENDVVPFWLAIFAALQLARVWAIASLGGRWTTRVLVLPGVPPVAKGPYRWLRHPNYVVVALEIGVVPLALDLPLAALLFSVANAALLAHRIRVENRALAWAAPAMQGVNSPDAIAPGSLAKGYSRR